MSLADHRPKIGRQRGSALFVKLASVKLQILQHQLAHDDSLSKEADRQNALPEVGRAPERR
jgi:hypothetical protein